MSTWIGGVRDVKRDWISAGTAGDRVLVQGGQFGTIPGSVSVGGLLLKDLAWRDGEIAATLPPVSVETTGTLQVAIGGVITAGQQFTIHPGAAPPPPAGKAYRLFIPTDGTLAPDIHEIAP